MTNLITAIIGFAMVAAFLAFMVVWVPALPLIVIIVGVMALLAFDIVQSVRGAGDSVGRQ